MRELQTWGSRTPRRCEKAEHSSDVIIWIIAIIAGFAILVMR